MKLKDILRTFGPAVLSIAYPPAMPIIAAVNAALPDDQKLGDSCTGDELYTALTQRNPALLDAEYAFETEVIKQRGRSMNTANSSTDENYQATRAFIAKWSFIVVGSVTVGITAAYIDAVHTGNTEVIKELMNGWPMVVALLAPFVVLLKVYMGVLEREHKNRLNAANGKTAASSLALGLSAYLMRNKK